MTYQDLMELTASSTGHEDNNNFDDTAAFMAGADIRDECDTSLEYCIANHLV